MLKKIQNLFMYSAVLTSVGCSAQPPNVLFIAFQTEKAPCEMPTNAIKKFGFELTGESNTGSRKPRLESYQYVKDQLGLRLDCFLDKGLTNVTLSTTANDLADTKIGVENLLNEICNDFESHKFAVKSLSGNFQEVDKLTCGKVRGERMPQTN